jgi:MFS family permease
MPAVPIVRRNGMWKSALWSAWLLVAFGLFAAAFGYFDDQLDDVRRYFGCALILAGIGIVVPALLRLIDDWPRLKPVHNVDRAFAQVMLGLIVLSLAGVLGGRPEAFLEPFGREIPKRAAPDQIGSPLGF